MYILKVVKSYVAATHCFYGSDIILPEHLKQSMSQRYCVYFAKIVVAINYRQRCMVNSRKIEGFVYLKKAIVALLF